MRERARDKGRLLDIIEYADNVTMLMEGYDLQKLVADKKAVKAGGLYLALDGVLVSPDDDSGGENTTGIISTTNFTNYTNSAGAWYDMQGRKLNAQPTRKGLYIHGGKKVAIK